MNKSINPKSAGIVPLRGSDIEAAISGAYSAGGCCVLAVRRIERKLRRISEASPVSVITDNPIPDRPESIIENMRALSSIALAVENGAGELANQLVLSRDRIDGPPPSSDPAPYSSIEAEKDSVFDRLQDANSAVDRLEQSLELALLPDDSANQAGGSCPSPVSSPLRQSIVSIEDGFRRLEARIHALANRIDLPDPIEAEDSDSCRVGRVA